MGYQLTFWSFIQLAASLHQLDVSYTTRMIYSHQSSISWRPKAALSQMSIMSTKRGRGQEGKLGGLRTPIMGERGCWCWRMMTMVKLQRKNAQRCTWRKGNAVRFITAAVLLWWCEGGVWQRQEYWWWDLRYEDVEAKDKRKKLKGSAKTTGDKQKLLKNHG